MSTALATRIAEEYAAAAAELPARVVSAARRELAVQALCTHGLPGMRDENWKYANLRALERVRFAPPGAAAPANRLSTAALPVAIAGYDRQTFVDGVFAPELSGAVRHKTQDGAAARECGHPGDARFALLNDAFAADAAQIRTVHEERPRCIEVLFVAHSEATRAASYPRLDVKVSAGTRLNLIERHVSIGSDANFVNTAIEIDIAKGASVTHFRVQQMGARATWIDTLTATVGSDASYQQHLVQLGALAARSTCHVRLAGAGAATRLHALAAAAGQQTHDAYVLIEHACAHTRSEQIFRGIAAGRARVAFNGKVNVCAGAPGTDSRQSLRGLLAGPEAEIDLRPQLQIHTDDVRCSHGATAGKLDESVLFYLLSRGLDPDTAQQLLKWAFLADVVAKIDIPDLKSSIERALAGRIEVAEDLKELL
ncbi:MAG TPA: Fe-S cluster assembly protein SufD [Steroidobacteraceae bacterium]|jgi:Fe-S cluster assembly protein SufD|nr:Fe-S cluster assembly protein SufD [Steroidobacteraceae bacterium]